MNNTIKLGPSILYMIINHYLNHFIVLAKMQWYNTVDVRKHCQNLQIYLAIVLFRSWLQYKGYMPYNVIWYEHFSTFG